MRLTIYTPNHAVFDLRRATRHVRHALGGAQIAPDCLKVQIVKGQWRAEAGYSSTGTETGNRFAQPLSLVLRATPARPPITDQPFRAPYDGCEIGGLYGHRWNDAWGTRAAVEIWLTDRGRHFFNDRAAARDLAYFVRSRRVQQTMRLSDTPGAGLAWYVHRYPRRVVRLKSPSTTVPKDVIGVYIGRQSIVFTATSSTRRRFFVVAKRGTYKLPQKNLGDLAFVF